MIKEKEKSSKGGSKGKYIITIKWRGIKVQVIFPFCTQGGVRTLNTCMGGLRSPRVSHSGVQRSFGCGTLAELSPTRALEGERSLRDNVVSCCVAFFFVALFCVALRCVLRFVVWCVVLCVALRRVLLCVALRCVALPCVALCVNDGEKKTWLFFFISALSLFISSSNFFFLFNPLDGTSLVSADLTTDMRPKSWESHDAKAKTR